MYLQEDGGSRAAGSEGSSWWFPGTVSSWPAVPRLINTNDTVGIYHAGPTLTGVSLTDFGKTLEEISTDLAKRNPKKKKCIFIFCEFRQGKNAREFPNLIFFFLANLYISIYDSQQEQCIYRH